MSDIVIKTEGLERRFGPVRALRELDLSIAEGTIVALLGPNGAGKTTFLRLLMGLLEPTAGQAWMLGSDTQVMSDEVVPQVGYMGDSSAPPAWATVAQLADLKAATAPRFDRTLLQTCLRLHELGYAGARYGSLSKGQKKWVQASIVLAGRPRILLMDEPAEGLDPSVR